MYVEYSSRVKCDSRIAVETSTSSNARPRCLLEDGERELTVLVGKSDSSWGRGSRAAPVPPDAAAAPDAQRCALLREKIVAPFSLRHGTIVFGTCSVYT